MKTILYSSLLLAGGLLISAFIEGLCTARLSQAGKDRKMHEDMSERQIDKMLADSFPASDPPSTY